MQALQTSTFRVQDSIFTPKPKREPLGDHTTPQISQMPSLHFSAPSALISSRAICSRLAPGQNLDSTRRFFDTMWHIFFRQRQQHRVRQLERERPVAAQRIQAHDPGAAALVDLAVVSHHHDLLLGIQLGELRAQLARAARLVGQELDRGKTRPAIAASAGRRGTACSRGRRTPRAPAPGRVPRLLVQC